MFIDWTIQDLIKLICFILVIILSYLYIFGHFDEDYQIVDEYKFAITEDLLHYEPIDIREEYLDDHIRLLWEIISEREME